MARAHSRATQLTRPHNPDRPQFLGALKGLCSHAEGYCTFGDKCPEVHLESLSMVQRLAILFGKNDEVHKAGNPAHAFHNLYQRLLASKATDYG